MPRDYEAYMEDILEAIGKVRRYTWDVVQNKLPTLEQQLMNILAK